MKINAYAKINLALNVLGIRPDGYHEMDMLMQHVSLCDTLELVHAEQDEVVLECDDPELATGRNLVLKAAGALNDHCGTRHGARIRLIKRIPIKAGLGGGSADCAATLRALNRLWKLNLPQAELRKIGAQLGADVSFCMSGRAARVQGLGERVQRIVLPGGVPIVIYQPGHGLSTPSIFRAWDEEREHTAPSDIPQCIDALMQSDLIALSRSATNMLTSCAAHALPEIADAITLLRTLGAEFAAMSGSGSAVFGAFSRREMAKAAVQTIGSGAILCETR
ncbi:4-(cytidine 5'-diphospho)-2-C-methyl-D-erythritol kinase [Eubacteriales bacterium OttesenSCG-928-N13]|nr:4-(cytidine 5'-diphospho)-2-C-methyl-D-erythritol kinase [Eubacteriales bacterium OttesenSCG-928-N13]